MSDRAEENTEQDDVNEEQAQGQPAEEKPRKRTSGRRRQQTVEGDANGEQAPDGSEIHAAEGDKGAVVRAEALMDRAGERAGQLVVLAGQQLRRIRALAREGAEDMWAEAQSMRQNNRSDGR